jgi:hypothetical protein
MSTFAERIASLSNRVESIDLKLKSIDAERADHAIEASQGSTSALKKVAALDAEHDQLVRSRSILTNAADQLDAQLRQEEQAAAAADREQRSGEARKVGTALAALNIELDAMMVQLRQCFERREAMLTELGSLGGISASTVKMQASKEPASAAARYAGLARFLSIEPVTVSAIRPLASSNGILPTEAAP